MRRPYQILYPLFSLFLVRVDLTDLKPVTMSVDILKVYDGDTVLIRRGAFQSKVRLSKIDAPEKTQPFAHQTGNAGEISKMCLEKILGKKALLSIYGIDIYGRILGDLDDVSFELIKRGCACIYPHAKFDSQQQKYIYLRALQMAKRKRLGLWAFGGVEQPKAWRKKNKHHFKRRI